MNGRNRITGELVILLLTGAFPGMAACSSGTVDSSVDSGADSGREDSGLQDDGTGSSDDGIPGDDGASPDDGGDSVDDEPVRPSGAVVINPDKTISIGGRKTFPVYIYEMCNWHFELNTGVEPCNPAKNADFTFSFDPIPHQHVDSPSFHNLAKYEETKTFYLLNERSISNFDESIINGPYVFAYAGFDEPTEDKRASVQAAYDNVKAWEAAHPQAARHPVMLNVWTDIISWSGCADIMTWDIYPFKNNTEYWVWEDSVYVYEQYSRQSSFEDKYDADSLDKPLWAVIQSHGIADGAGAAPISPSEARVLTYSAITMNVNGIGYWGYLNWGGSLESNDTYAYGTPGLYNDPVRHAYYRQLARELTSLNDILVLPTSDYAWHYRPGTRVSFSKTLTKHVLWKDRTNFNFLLKESGNTSYLIVVNKDSREISGVEITITNLNGSQTATTLGLETSGSSRAGRTLSVTDGKLTDDFDGYAAHVYEIRP